MDHDQLTGEAGITHVTFGDLISGHYSGLVLGSSTSDAALAFAQMHISRLAADEGFVHFNLSAEFLSEEMIMPGQSEALEHEPCGLLSDPEATGNFATADTLLAIDQHPESSHPLVQAERRILEDRSNLERELLLTLVAEPNPPSLDKRVFRRATSWTRNLAIRPA